ncbi:MAG: ABC-type branched-subunit amino acid transport system ATPase component [Glaciecola sp.]|jgi:ABC-type branched-subunit amino acid transport system ATPase component/predicted MFS family arabinose efflux permease
MTSPTEQTDGDLRQRARARLGVTGQATSTRLRDGLKDHGLGLYPLAALGGLNVVDGFQAFAFTVLTPEISRSLGLGIGAIAGAVAIRALAAAVSPLPMVALVQSKPRRAILAILTGLGWSLMTLGSGLITTWLGLVIVFVGDGLTAGSVVTLHQPLLMDAYPPTLRVRVMSAYGAIARLGNVLAPGLVALLVGPMDLTWRGAFLVLGGISTLTTLGSLGLRDPGFGHFDADLVRETVRGSSPVAEVALKDRVVLGFWEIFQRVSMIPTMRRLLAGYAIIGVLTIPYATFISFFLDERWNLGPGQRGLFFSYEAVVAVVSLLAYGTRGERQFAESPAKVLTTAATFFAASVVFVAAAGLSPNFALMLICFGLASAALGIIGPALTVALLSIIPATMRAHAAALVGIFTVFGALAGALLLTGIEERFGIVGSMVSLALPGILGAIVVGSARRFIEDDLDRMIDEVIEDETISQLRATGKPLPLLAARGIDFSYGQVQVLFGVDFSVDEGEMAALLGVNGAGKSTLLKVISGIGLPDRGSVRLQGHDITFLDAERRVDLGITQVPGGRAVFAPLTVSDNLRAYGHSIRRTGRSISAAMDDCFDAFPRLAERRNSLAGQLSGGEQQMLGLSKALILRPKLLLIDELSLGLAPVIVEQLLAMVRQINQTGTAIVLVEQSVNIALNLVDHAYFMEKGEMRFDGAAADLLGRDDLLRAVFLTGSSVATGIGGSR